jgi:thioredoxin-related protein
MRYFIAFYTFTIYLFAYSYQSESFNYPDTITVDESADYVILNNNLEDSSIETVEELEYIEYESTTPLIKYMDLKEAIREARSEHKFLLIKIESTNCPTCSKLNTLLDNNNNIKNMINKYTKAVKFNSDYDKIPPKLDYIGTPTLFLFDLEGKEMLIKLQGSEAIEDIEKSLELFINQ